jgi:acylglycerol lipase
MIHEFKKIKTSDDILLHALIREKGAQMWLIHVHSYGEHHGRHKFILDNCSQYYNILQFDLRGHGESEGNISKINDFNTLCRDLDDVIHFLKDRYKMKNYVLLGHGLGGLICADYIQNFAKRNCYPNKLFLSSPLLHMSGVVGEVLSMTDKYIFSLADKTTIPFKVPNFIQNKKLSHDGRVYQSYKNDMLCKTSISSKFLVKLLKTIRDVSSRPLRADCEVYCALAEEDFLVNSYLVKEFFSRFEKGAMVTLIEGAYHELHNEVEMYRSKYQKFLFDSLIDTQFQMKAL